MRCQKDSRVRAGVVSALVAAREAWRRYRGTGVDAQGVVLGPGMVVCRSVMWVWWIWVVVALSRRVRALGNHSACGAALEKTKSAASTRAFGPAREHIERLARRRAPSDRSTPASRIAPLPRRMNDIHSPVLGVTSTPVRGSLDRRAIQ